MRRLRRLAVAALATAAALSACGRRGPGADDLAAAKREACACKDAACAVRVDQRMEALLAGLDEHDLDAAGAATAVEIAACLRPFGVK